MLQNILFIILGLSLLIVAGDLLVRGAVSLANALKIPTLLISLTVVAFGTSAPEFVVTLQDVMGGSSADNGIAMGNIVGSNIANILLVLGLPAVLYPIAMNLPGTRRHASVMLIATVLFMYFAYVVGSISMLAGITLSACIAAYVGYIGFNAIKSGGADNPLIDDLEEYEEQNNSIIKTIAFLVLGIAGLAIGARLLVDNGSTIAEDLGVRRELIGLTIVAFGTSLPELATVIAAALKKHAEVAVGNIVGSNIFNLLFVGGTAGLVGSSELSQAAKSIDMPVMFAATLVLALLIYTKTKISRPLGLLMFATYVGYIAYIGIKSGAV